MSGVVAQNVGRRSGLVKAPEAAGGAWTLIQTITASSDATISFTSGLDSTYDEYCFQFVDIHPSGDNENFQFNASLDSGSNYNIAKTSAYTQGEHNEADSSTFIGYKTSMDLAQGTGAQVLVQGVNYANDSMCSGYMHLYAPSDTTFAKHFISYMGATMGGGGDYIQSNHVSGYINTASAVDAIQFSYSANNIDTGTISLYGIG